MVRMTVLNSVDQRMARALADLHERTAVVAYAHIYVLPDMAGHGLGRRLIGVAAGTRRLWVMEANTAARHFYEAVGWQPSGGTRPGYPGAPELEYIRGQQARHYAG